MDILSSRTIEITQLALSGLMERQAAIASNTANVATPNYQRKEVCFEEQLNEIIERDNTRKQIRAYNSSLEPSVAKNPTIPETGFIPYNPQPKTLSLEQLKFLSQSDYGQFSPEILRDYSYFDVENDNNVNVEKEMTDMAKTGIKFNVLASLETRAFSGLSEVIKSGD